MPINSSSPSARFHRPPKGVSAKLHRKLDRYLLACSATTVAVAAGSAHDANAAIIYSGTKNVSIPAMSFTGMYFDIDGQTSSTTKTAGSDINIFDVYGIGTYNGQKAFYHSVTFFGPNKTGNNTLATLSTTTGLTLRLAAGVTIGSIAPSGTVFGRQNDLVNQFYNYNTGAKTGPFSGQWTTGGIGYIGFKFVTSANQTDYGWMRVSFDPNAFSHQQVSLTVIDWAYNDSGGSILTGQGLPIPEPNTVALAFLGAGAFGLALWRQQRRQKEAAQKS